jgi:hypothetical protein
MRNLFFAAIAAAIIAVPAAAPAQGEPSYSQPAQSADEQIRGRVASFDGAYALSVRDERGFIDNVQLHQGTIINPTGLTLAPGMIVSVIGYNNGPYLSANEIDTPYQYAGGVPYYAGHPWDYYGPTIGLSFFFGNPGWWHGGYFGGGYRFVGGARVYNSVHVTNVYRAVGGTSATFHGRDVIVPRARGGYYGAGRPTIHTNAAFRGAAQSHRSGGGGHSH